MSTETTTLKPESFDAHLEDSHHDEPTHSVKDTLRASGAHAVQAAEELKAAAEAKAREWRNVADEKTAELKEKAEVAYADTKVKLQSIQKDTEAYVRANPLKAVLAAVGAGFLLGVLARR
ncbi:MAG: hypothetical protein WCO60_09795 [Verrucomicrobiota bacterium]